MGRSGKIALGAAIVGLMTAMSLGMALQHHRPPDAVALPSLDPLERMDDEPGDCRTETVPDPICEAAWEAQRRRFFGVDGDKAPQP